MDLLEHCRGEVTVRCWNAKCNPSLVKLLPRWDSPDTLRLSLTTQGMTLMSPSLYRWKETKLEYFSKFNSIQIIICHLDRTFCAVKLLSTKVSTMILTCNVWCGVFMCGFYNLVSSHKYVLSTNLLNCLWCESVSTWLFVSCVALLAQWLTGNLFKVY